jgi:hypothetical protein
VDRALLEHAATLAPSSLVRSLDAIISRVHSFARANLRALLSDDVRMTQVAASLGLPASVDLQSVRSLFSRHPSSKQSRAREIVSQKLTGG